MRDTDAAWAAGFIDGEGCILIGRGRTNGASTYYSLQLNATQLDPEPLRRLQSLFGGSVYLTRANRPDAIWRWTTASRKALVALTAMLPYLTTKRREAEIAIVYQVGKSGRGHLRHVAGAETTRNEEFKAALEGVKVERKGMAA